MLNNNDVRSLLIQEVCGHNIKDCGYDCMNGRRYVEIRNVVFECTEDCIFRNIGKLPYLEDDWYEKNYDPILLKDNQLQKCIDKLIENPNTRQAVIIMSSTDNLQCTMYIHVSLIKKGVNTYELEYSVHMRSNDSVEFRSDYQWHINLYNNIYYALKTALTCNIILVKKNIIWCVDSLQLYEQYFPDVVKSL